MSDERYRHSMQAMDGDGGDRRETGEALSSVCPLPTSRDFPQDSVQCVHVHKK